MLNELTADELIDKWNEFCGASNRYDLEIYKFEGIRDFAMEWCNNDLNHARSLMKAMGNIESYSGEIYYYWRDDKVSWFYDPLGYGSPIDMDLLEEWLDRNYGEEVEGEE